MSVRRRGGTCARRCGVMLLAASCSLTLGAGAQTAASGATDPERITASLSWVRAADTEGCISTEALSSEVEARLGRSVFGARSSADMRIEGSIQRVDSPNVRWRVRFTLYDVGGKPLGHRDLESDREDCAALDDSLALIVALLVDLHKDEAREQQRRLAPRPPAKKPTTFRIPKRTRKIDRRRAPEVWSAVGVSTSYGYLPQAALGIRLAVGLDPAVFWPMELDAILTFPSERHTNTGGARFTARSVGLSICPLTLRQSWVVTRACAGGRLGQLIATGFGFDETHEPNVLVPSGLARVTAMFPLGDHFGVSAGAGALVPLKRPRFVADEAGTVLLHQPWPVSPLVELAGAVRF